MTREIQLAYKGNCCAVCGLTVDEMVQRYGTFKRMTEFHHIDPYKKAPNYPSLIQRKISSEQLDELDKCALLCRQCHGIIHAQNMTCKLKITLSIDEHQYSQEINGQCVVDRIDKRVKFISDECFKLGQYVVKIGSNPPERMIGLEMDSKEFFSSIFRSLPEIKTVTIWDENTRIPQFRIESLGNGDFRLQQSFSFPFLTLESIDDFPKFWVRGGMYLDEEGKIMGEGKIDTVFTFDDMA